MRKYILPVLSAITGFIMGANIFGKIERRQKYKEQAMSDKHLALFLMMNQWVQVKQEGKKLTDYLEEREYRNIAVYGMSYAGETLVRELEESDIKVKYGIDKKADEIYSDIKVVSPDSYLEDVDAVIVTSISFMEEIEKMLSEKLACPIISLEDILFEV